MDPSSQVGDYRLVEQLYAGEDGAAYRALCPDQTEVEVRILNRLGPDEPRWTRLAERLRLVRLIEHNAIAQILEIKLEEDPAYVVMQRAGDRRLSDLAQELDSWDAARVATIANAIAAAVAAAHRLGLSHGRLDPAAIHLDETDRVRIDFSGIATGGIEAQGDFDSFHPARRAASAHDAAPADDVFSLASLLIWLFTPDGFQTGLLPESFEQTLREGFPHAEEQQVGALSLAVQEALDVEPSKRPPVQVLLVQLRNLGGERAGDLTRDGGGMDQTFISADEDGDDESEGDAPFAPAAQDRIGRYRLIEKLGEGAMGAVFKAEDLSNGRHVAIKLASAVKANRPLVLKRFLREARLLAEVDHANIVKFLEVNEDRGVWFIAMEFVSGTDLKQFLTERGPLEELLALAIVADMARALVDAHERGIVHRDVKPANVLLSDNGESAAADNSDQPPELATRPRIKLSDFGLARHVDQSESMQLTKAGTLLGTPVYMAPEQCSGNGEITPATDVYAMGVTLFELLAGRPPFDADSPMELVSLHCHQPPPPLEKLNPDVSEGTARIVAKALAKHATERYADASQMLDDLDRQLRGEPSNVAVHPQLPAGDSTEVFAADFEWELDSPADKLWPLVSNTERLNCAVGLPSVEYTTRRDPQRGLQKFGSFRLAGLQIAWEEHPFEWIEGRRLGVLREFTHGPFKWFLSSVELFPRPDGGTRLKHSVRIEPRGWLGWLVASMEVKLKGRRGLDRVYRRIDAATSGRLGDAATVDPFAEPESLPAGRQRRLEERLQALAGRGVDAEVVEQLGSYIARAPAQEVARIRPRALARRLGLDVEQTVEGCLLAVVEGLLELGWDILCPTCRISIDVEHTLKAIENHARCEVCDLDFEVDFGNSLEMIFRAHPDIRQADTGTYCAGGPEHSPHVVMQLRLAQDERIELQLALGEGEYRLRSPQLPYTLTLDVQPVRGTSRGEVALSPEEKQRQVPTIKAGRQVLALSNRYPQELVVRLERTIPRRDVVTAAQASAMAVFRELFPQETLGPGRLMNVATVTLLLIEMDGVDQLYATLADARTFEVIQEHMQAVQQTIRQAGGAIVKMTQSGVVATFDMPKAALEAALEMSAALSSIQTEHPLTLRAAIHRGEALVASTDDRMDYFGKTVNVASRLTSLIQGGQLLLTEPVTSDPAAALLIRKRQLNPVIVQLTDPIDGLVQRMELP